MAESGACGSGVIGCGAIAPVRGDADVVSARTGDKVTHWDLEEEEPPLA